ncbi:MAG: NAD-dependent epimerase/dehydratase family protein [Proteobacteria bacterium]|nr:NAD-dependent epimerase/dehydratase family protein [Pseudomonadota bacterium]MCP4919147.1 NAD-dependent epimerase/dehydratase family protein [Pseudomonadota bacterium]
MTLVTGGSGFLGRWLVPLLSCEAPSRAELDITSRGDWLQFAGAERVLHLAAQTSPRLAESDPATTMAQNVQAVRYMSEVLPQARVVHVSTCHVYGIPERLPIDEANLLRPRGVYASSKATAERLLPRAIIARPFNLTGPGQSTEFAPADWAAQGKAGETHIACGDVSLVRDYLDVRDAAAGLVTLLERGVPGEAYNLCRGEGVTLEWILRTASGGEPAPRQERRRAHDVPVLVGDPARAQALGWSPRITLERSLTDLRESV